MADAILWILAYGHVLSAIAWLGSGILTGFVVGPNLRKMAPAAALEFNARIIPKITRFVEMAAVSTLLFGVLLLYYNFHGDLSFLMDSTQGYILSAGILIALFTAILAFSFIVPSFNKVAAFAKGAIEGGQPPPPEMMKYAKRARLSSTAGVFLLLFVLAMMVASGFLF